jgi:hypothetical protein
MLCTYTGSDSRMYPDYRDTATGRSLEASPGGGSYDIEAVSGHAPLPPGDGRWVVAVAREGVFEVPAPPPWAPVPPVPAAEPEPAAPVTPEEAGDSPAEVES